MKKTIIYGLTILLIMLNPIIGFNQTTIPTIKAKSNKVSVRLGSEYYPNAWEITPNSEKDLDEMGTDAAKEGTFFAFITDVDSIGFILKRGEFRAFCIILNEKDTVWARAKGRTPKADFDEAYRKANDGKTLVELPAAYELVNIIMAMTPTGVRDSDMIEHNIPYYNKVQTYFGAFKNHKAVSVMDSLLKANLYYDIKMDSYSHDLEKGKLVKKAAYNRIAWGKENTIMPYISLFEDFARKSKFDKFYKQNKPFYQGLVRAYQDTLGIPAMLSWLKKNFPNRSRNCIKIVFSPLVNANQSATFFDSNDFTEHQAHVDFPFFSYNAKTAKYSQKATDLTRGDIVFTELNHGYENDEFERNKQNRALFKKIPFNLSVFATKGTPASSGSYNTALLCAQEYMNWALVSLRYADFAPKEDLEALLKSRENFMVKRRGFTKFAEFNRFLIDIYTKRSEGKTVADLYPQIIKWFEDNNK
jgi:Domain of unknown function (DUF4932)